MQVSTVGDTVSRLARNERTERRDATVVGYSSTYGTTETLRFR
jgi:hypothetical protein